jgi:hypothetical protein
MVLSLSTLRAPGISVGLFEFGVLRVRWGYLGLAGFDVYELNGEKGDT